MRELLGAEALEVAIFEEMGRDSKVCYMGEDVGLFGGAVTKLFSLYNTYGPERVMDMPLTENGFTGLAVGMAWQGQRPIVEYMYPDFLPLALANIIHGAAKQYYLSTQKSTTPLVIRSAQGIGSQCGAHHSSCVEGWLHNYPGIKIAVPTFPKDIYGMMKYAIRDDDPVIWLDGRTTIYTTKGEIPQESEDYLLPFGIANVVREGADVTILAWHKLLIDSMKAAESLEKQGISVEVIDPRTIIPFDYDTVLNSVKKTGKLIIAHEANVRGGAGGEIAAEIMDRGFEYLKEPIKRIGTPNTFIPVGAMEWGIVPNHNNIIRTVKELLGKPLLEEEMDK